MTVTYFFPVFKNDNSKDFFEKFFVSKVFEKNKDYTLIVACEKSDKKNYEYLSALALKNERVKVFVFDKNFTFNDAFKNCLESFDGDVLLLGDTKLNKVNVIFEKCLEKFEKGANVVHVVKRKSGFKGFIFNIISRIYNFFIKIFTNKTDKLNITSLGLIDKDVLDVLKVLPNKCCYLKNTRDLKGFECRTIYVEEDTQTTKLNYKTKTSSLIISIVSSCVFLALTIFTIVLTTITKNILPALLLSLIFLIICSLAVTVITLPKHFFEIRNKETKNCKFKISKLN